MDPSSPVKVPLPTKDDSLLLLYFSCLFICSCILATLIKTVALYNSTVQTKELDLMYDESDDEAPLLSHYDLALGTDCETKITSGIAYEPRAKSYLNDICLSEECRDAPSNNQDESAGQELLS